MTCPHCATDNPPVARFCRGCGARLGPGCPTCGAPNSADSRFCGACGAALSAVQAHSVAPASYTPKHLAEKILARRSAIEGEMKQVTVLFCDLCNSTTIAEQLGPERMHDLLNRFFARAMTAVHRYEGTVNQFLGDGLMVLFGAPLALEDHARRAMFAAVEIRRAVAASPLSSGVEVKLRIGINSGAVVVGRIGDDLRTDYTAIGDVTNVAARLQHIAEPGEIVIGATAYRLATDTVRVEPLGPIQLRGKTAPVDAYRLIEVGLRRPPLRATGGHALTPFVGREAEQRAIADVLAQVRAGQGAVVGIVGEPGLGKSRLLLEFRKSLGAGDVTYLETRSAPYSVSMPYSLLLDLLRENCGIADLDTPDEIAGKVRFGLAEVGLAEEPRVAALLGLLGVKDASDLVSADTLKRRAFDTLRSMALRGSARSPLVIVLEDMHWTDRGSEEFFAEFADSIAGAPILVLATYRPGYSPPWLDRPHVIQLALRPLSAGDSRRIVEAATPTSANDAVTRVVARGGGNPFFLEELSRTVGDPAVGAGGIPETIRGTIAARIDRLGDHSKRLLQVASVVGREFSASVLEAVWDGERPIDPWLRDLSRGGFVHQRLTADDEYAFQHALTQEVAYASLLERQRLKWHRTVAIALEARHADAIAAVTGLLAHHFALSDDHERAVAYSVVAGEQAQRRWAHAEALSYFQTAIERASMLPESRRRSQLRIDAVLKQAEVRFALGQHVEQLSALEGIGAIVESLADPGREAAWNYWVGFLHSLTGSRPEVAISHCEKAASIARAHAIEDIEAYAHSCLAQVLQFTGAFPRALALGEGAVASFERRGERWWAGRTLSHLNPIANARGEWDRALAYGRRALDHATALDDQRLRIIALLRLASTHIQRGQPDEGLRLCDDAERLSPGPFDMATVRAIRGYGLAKAGALHEGISLLEEVMIWLERSRLRYTHCQMGLWLAEAHLAAGARAAVRAVLDSVVTTASGLGYRALECAAHRLLAAAAESVDVAQSHRRRAAAIQAALDSEQ